MNTALMLLFIQTTTTLNLPTGVLGALCYVESNHNVRAMHLNDGGADSVGVCQIKLGTARLLGFKGSARELKIPIVNVYYAGKYLRSQLDRYNGDLRKGISAYNAGTHRVNEYGQTKNRKYVAKVLQAWAEER
jgi:soluble lytic murein transglycosylase-like protein